MAFDGFPFVETRDYDHQVRLDASTGDFQEYVQRSLPPEVDHTKPKLAEEEAIQAAERLLIKPRPAGKEPYTEYDLRRGRLAKLSELSESGSKVDVTRRLGWFVPKGETKATLAWRLPYDWQDKTRANGSHPGGIGYIYIDAGGGRRLPSSREG